MSTALAAIAQSSGVSVDDVTDVLKGMIISAKNQHGAQVSNAELAVVSGVCAKYDLNPMVKECAAFISGGKLQVVLMIDGWYRIVNRQPNFDGVEFDDHIDDKSVLTAITCRMYIKGRTRPVVVTEYMSECRDPKSSVWQKWPARMLRHKAYIQCARMTFGISDMIDNDEASRITQGEKNITQQASSVSTVDYQAIDQAMGECEDHDALNKLCAEIRAEMEKRGTWNSEKVTLADMKSRHKARIDAAVVTDEFEVVEDDNDGAVKSDVEDSATDDDVPFE
ncbi:Bet-like ssDNA annealing protein [Serratia phage Eta]|uniref:Recombination protein bet n=1 Tax=Serratia phage Eta TaxID=1282995 RepID=R9VYI4_9CAUD|nr:Bet-like ssDNA annealing protein [Serratia phage Eta]AGN89465.1 recombination protein bet [Serratia phage Eta]